MLSKHNKQHFFSQKNAYFNNNWHKVQKPKFIVITFILLKSFWPQIKATQ